MKFIVDIPDHIYELAKENKLKYWTQGITDNIVFNALKNATPLEEVLEDIKAEIEELKSCCDDEWDAFLTGRKEAYNNVLEIIDKHISGKEETRCR